MLSLTRQPGESIMIGDTIKITYISNDHGVITLGVEAPTTQVRIPRPGEKPRPTRLYRLPPKK